MNLGTMNPGRCLCCIMWGARGVDSISSRKNVVVSSNALLMASHRKTIHSVYGQLVSPGR